MNFGGALLKLGLILSKISVAYHHPGSKQQEPSVVQQYIQPPQPLRPLDKSLDSLDIHQVEVPNFPVKRWKLLFERGKHLFARFYRANSEDELGRSKRGELMNGLEANTF